MLSCEAATQTDLKPDLATVVLRKSLKAKALRSRPRSLIDYKSYIDTKLLVAKFLEQSSCTMTPDIHELVEDIKSVLKSDEEHMEEAINSAYFLEQVFCCWIWTPECFFSVFTSLAYRMQVHLSQKHDH